MSQPDTPPNTAQDLPGDFDPKAYRSALGGFGTGVALVAARDAEGRAHGMIINSLTSVSLHPPIMLWCLANTSNAFQVFTQCEAFSLNILRSDDHDIAQRQPVRQLREVLGAQTHLFRHGQRNASGRIARAWAV